MKKAATIAIIIFALAGIFYLIFFTGDKRIDRESKLPFSAGKYEQLIRQGDRDFNRMHLLGWRKAEESYHTASRMKKSPQLEKKRFLTLAMIAIREKDESILNPATYKKIATLIMKEPTLKQTYLMKLLNLYQDTPLLRDKTKRITSAHKEYIDPTAFDLKNSPMDFYLYIYLLNVYTFDPQSSDERMIEIFQEQNVFGLLKEFEEHPLFIYFNPGKVRGKGAEIEKKYPQFAEYLFHRGNLFFKDSRLIDAFKYYEKVTQLIPDYTNAINGTANIYYFTVKNYEKAISLYDKTLKIDPLNPVALFGKGVSLHNLKQFPASNQVFDLMLQKQAMHHGEAHYYKANNYFLTNNPENADEHIQKALRLLPKSGEVNYLKGQMLFKEKKHIPAETFFLKSLEDDDFPNAFTYYHLGMIHLNESDWLFFDYFSEALKSFTSQLTKMKGDIVNIANLDIHKKIKQWMKQDRQRKYFDFEKKSQGVVKKIASILEKNKENRPQVRTTKNKHDITTQDGNNLLHLAAVSGDIPKMEKLLKEGVFIDTRNRKGYTPLYFAAMMGQAEAVAYLLEQGAQVNVRMPSGYTPLHEAAFGGHEKVIRLLIDHGADIYLKDDMGSTPVRLVHHEHIHIATLLAPLHEAFKEEKNEEIKKFLENNSYRIQQQDIINFRDHDGCTLLYHAVLKGDNEMVSWLLSRGANPNISDNRGLTPLFKAQLNGHNDIGNLLLAKGATFATTDYFAMPLGKKESYIWYASRNVWVVKTKNHALLFNFLPSLTYSVNYGDPSFITGKEINPMILSNTKVLHFLSHKPIWHNNIEVVYHWGRWLKQITHIMSLPAPGQNYYKQYKDRHIQARPNHGFNIKDAEIKTVAIGGKAVGYWIKVDGQVIFYAGKKLCEDGEDSSQVIQRLKKPVQSWGPVDMMFLDIHGKKDHSQTQTALEVIKVFRPRMMFPIYAGEGDHFYKSFASQLKELGIATTIGYAHKSGDRFSIRP
jgi:ankyrin repeat protein/tetratricopeptide (TPR) repeat protein